MRAPSRGKERRLVARLRVVVAAIVGLQRLVEERRQRCGDDDVGSGMSVSSSLEGWAAAHSSNPAMRPASPPAVSTTVQPERARMLGDARMRDERRAARATRRASRRRASAHRLSSPSLDVIVTASTRRSRNASCESRRRRLAAARADSRRRSRRARRARTARRPAARARRRRERSTMRLPRTSESSGSASRPSLSKRRRGNAHVGDADGGERLRGSRARRERDELRGPAPRIGHAVFDGVGGDEYRAVVVERARHAHARAARDRRAAGSRSPER